LFKREDSASYRRIEATSMINGMSRENPRLERVLWMLHIWSEYEVRGDTMMLERIRICWLERSAPPPPVLRGDVERYWRDLQDRCYVGNHERYEPHHFRQGKASKRAARCLSDGNREAIDA
jgi:hypothetical protein